jgi:hypothetical protein
MKHDYLWDKKGSDAEIERLEGLLSGFGYREEPAAVSNVVAFPSKAKRNLQPWIFAMAACAALAAIAIGVWNLSAISEEAPVDTVRHVEEIKLPELPAVTAPVDSTEHRASVVTAEQPSIKANRRKAPIRHKHTAAVRKRPNPTDPTVLTAEERFAYNQLMLALSITTSKLQIVQDSINGVEDIKTNER